MKIKKNDPGVIDRVVEIPPCFFNNNIKTLHNRMPCYNFHNSDMHSVILVHITVRLSDGGLVNVWQMA